jgi:hypothetical protein
VNISRKVRAWCDHQREWLLFFATRFAATPPPIPKVRRQVMPVSEYLLKVFPNAQLRIATCEEFARLGKLASIAFSAHGLCDEVFQSMSQNWWRGLVLYAWSGLPPVTQKQERCCLSSATASARELRLKWNREFPSLTIPEWDQGGGHSVVHRDLLDIASEMSRRHDESTD